MVTKLQAFPKREEELITAFWQQVSSFPEGHKIKNCLQCGTCTGTCPVSYAMDITPRQVIGLFRAGHLEDILQSRTIWICASCYSCTVRCPMGIKITDTLYALKRVAMEKRIYPNKFPVHTLSKAFSDSIYRYGRNYELGLGLRYFLKSNFVKLFTNLGYGITMLKHKRLPLLPKRIKQISQVRAIIEKANQFPEG